MINLPKLDRKRSLRVSGFDTGDAEGGKLGDGVEERNERVDFS
jgi:hypothetical protein